MVTVKGTAKVVALIGVFAGAMAGCATTTQQPTTLNTGTTLSKKLSIKKQDFAGDSISANSIKEAIAKNIIAVGNKPLAYHEDFRSGRRYDTYGIKSDVSDNGIQMDYVNGPKILTESGKPVYYQSHIIADIPVIISENGENYDAVLDFPAQISMGPAPFLPFTPSKYLFSENEAVSNLLSKFNSLNQIAIERREKITGEISVAFNPDSITANYERKLGKYPNAASMYNFTYAGKTLPLSVSIYPYRNGSKIEYSINIPYMVSDKISISQSDIDSIKSRIEAIAKD